MEAEVTFVVRVTARPRDMDVEWREGASDEWITERYGMILRDKMLHWLREQPEAVGLTVNTVGIITRKDD